MPQNKRESLIYTVMMSFLMVLWMSMYNVAIHNGSLGLDTVREGWLGFPIAYIYAMIFDWFIVSTPAKKFAFRFLVGPESSTIKKVLSVSCCMVIPMVIVMSIFESLEACIRTGIWSNLPVIWLTNIPKNLIMALSFQLLIAGPVTRKIFRSVFPEGKVLA